MSNKFISDLKLTQDNGSIVMEYTRLADGKRRQSKLVPNFTGVDPENGRPKTSKLVKGASVEELYAHAEFVASNYAITAITQAQAYADLPEEEKEARRLAAVKAAQANQIDAADFAGLLEEAPQI